MGFFPHRATLWMAYNLTWLWHCLPGDSIGSHELRAESHKIPLLHCRCQCQGSVVTCASDWPTGYQLEVLRPPSTPWVWLICWAAHKTQENSLLTREMADLLWKVTYGSRAATSETHRARRGVGGESLPPTPAVSPAPTIINLEALSSVLQGFSWRLRYIDMID